MTKEVYFRLAKEEDCDDLFKWRNDPITVKFSPTGKVKYENHVNWFKNKIKDPDTHIFIITNQSAEQIGMVRFDKNGEKAEISINLNPEFRGLGYGKLSLRKALEFYFNNFHTNIMIAKIDPNNIISQKLFFNMGFKEVGRENQIYTELTKQDFLNNGIRN
ncbi:GNAT family N-acetyltransferase [Nanoarchaeota archaeon]